MVEPLAPPVCIWLIKPGTKNTGPVIGLPLAVTIWRPVVMTEVAMLTPKVPFATTLVCVVLVLLKSRLALVKIRVLLE
jgi:hypothetical protein